MFKYANSMHAYRIKIHSYIAIILYVKEDKFLYSHINIANSACTTMTLYVNTLYRAGYCTSMVHGILCTYIYSQVYSYI